MNQTTYRRLISVQSQGLSARVLRFLLRVFAVAYACLMRLRNWLYDIEVLPSTSVGVPVICVGNITTGGTGKTPLVIWLCQYLSEKGLQCAILTRGYKTESGPISDEPALLSNACENVQVIVDPNRIQGARTAIERYGAQVLIMDDGFQHRRLKRNMDILAIDATCPFGYGYTLPRGLLREPVSSLKRAAAMVITRTNQASDEQLKIIVETIQRYAPKSSIAKSIHRHTHAITSEHQSLHLEALHNKKVFAFCGIGNPEAFFDSLTKSGLQVSDSLVFDDHHVYTHTDMSSIRKQARESQADVILCTQKDWNKCERLLSSEKEFVFASVVMELDFIDGIDTITQQLDILMENCN